MSTNYFDLILSYYCAMRDDGPLVYRIRRLYKTLNEDDKHFVHSIAGAYLFQEP